jgi:hypothetical protein
MTEALEMVERVARRLYAKDWEAQTGNLRDGHFPYEDDDVQEYWRELAREAIAAMREPTEAMVRVGNDWDCAPFVAGRVWQEMIDAALSEGDD